MTLRVLPVTATRWPDFERLFSSRGAPHFCWCTPHRVADGRALDKAGRREAMQGLVLGGTPVGVLAYDGEEPVGWCSVAPREAYVKLGTSRAMPAVSEQPTWSVLCFFVPRARRGTGMALELLKGAVNHARDGGAVWVEGYPHDWAGTTASHRGTAALFAAAGFHEEETRWVTGPFSHARR